MLVNIRYFLISNRFWMAIHKRQAKTEKNKGTYVFRIRPYIKICIRKGIHSYITFSYIVLYRFPYKTFIYVLVSLFHIHCFIHSHIHFSYRAMYQFSYTYLYRKTYYLFIYRNLYVFHMKLFIQISISITYIYLYTYSY